MPNAGTPNAGAPDRRAQVRPGLDRRGAWLTVLFGAVAFATLAVWLVPWDWLPGGRLVPARATEVFTHAEIARAEAHTRVLRLLGWGSLAISTGLAVLLGVTRTGRWLAGLMPRRCWALRTVLTVLVLVVLGRLATLPFGLLARRRNLADGLTRQSLTGWLRDQAISTLVSWVFAGLLVLTVVGLARRFPRRWYVPAGALSVVAVFAGSLLYPLAVEPLFNRFTPMADGRFKESVLALAREEGVSVDDVLVSDASRRTTTINAYVSGLGGSRRIVVYDNLLTSLKPAEARSVIAHELAHARNHDVLLGTALGAAGSVAGVGLLALLLDSRLLRRRSGTAGAADPAVAALVLALMAVGGLLASPVQNMVSRAIEARADRVALQVTEDPAAFVRLQRRLALRSLADPTPPTLSQFWFGSHPTVLQRLGLASALEQRPR